MLLSISAVPLSRKRVCERPRCRCCLLLLLCKLFSRRDCDHLLTGGDTLALGLGRRGFSDGARRGCSGLRGGRLLAESVNIQVRRAQRVRRQFERFGKRGARPVGEVAQRAIHSGEELVDERGRRACRARAGLVFDSYEDREYWWACHAMAFRLRWEW